MPLLPLQRPPVNPIRLLAPVQLREEADLVRVAIETMHPGATRYLSKGGLTAKGRELEREAGYAGDTATWYRAVSRYLASVRCDQTKAEWPSAVQAWRRQTSTHLPFRVALLGKRAIVTRAAEGSGVTPGDELLEIEGRRTDDVRREIAPWTSVDGRIDAAKDAKFGDDPDLMGGGLDTFGPILWGLRTTWRTRFRQAGVKEVKGITFDAWRALDPAPDFKDAVAFERRGGRVAVLRIDSFAIGRVDPVEALRPHFAALRRDPGVRLVLDLRRCRGGSDAVPIALLRYLCPTPPAWASEIWMRTTAVPDRLRAFLSASNAALEQPDLAKFERRPDQSLRLLPDANPVALKPPEPLPERFEGPLDVLIGPANASGATTFLAHLRASRPARFVGERTAGSVDGFHGGPFWSLRLPHSGLTLRFPAYRFESGVKGRPGEGVEPDVAKRPTAEDLAGTADSVLEWVVANPPSASK